MFNTKFDYEYIKDNQIEGWQAAWKLLLEGRFISDGIILIEDTNAPIFRLGLTVKEAQDAIGFTGLTDTEVQFAEDHPDTCKIVKGKLVEIAGAREAVSAKKRLESLNAKLSEVDAAVIALNAGTFVYDGHNYYIDPVTITGQVVGLSMLPDTYTRTWKTADKEADGVSNVEVELNKEQIIAMAALCMAAYGANWDKGNACKKRLKERYNAGEDVSEVVIDLHGGEGMEAA